jgi:hypothetical protein
MENGDISNVTGPYLAFDISTIIFPQAEHKRRIWCLELLRQWQSASLYYTKVPRAVSTLGKLMSVGYNVMAVYYGPKRLWKGKMFQLNFLGIPFTSLNCCSNLHEFYNSIVQPEEIILYTSMSELAVQAAGKKGKLFDNWDAWLMNHSGIRPGVSGQVFSKGG